MTLDARPSPAGESPTVPQSAAVCPGGSPAYRLREIVRESGVAAESGSAVGQGAVSGGERRGQPLCPTRDTISFAGMRT